MRIKPLATSDRFSVVAVMDGSACPAEEFLLSGEESTRSSREGLLLMLDRVSEDGWQGVPAAWTHEADKARGIYEFIKGPLRLFFFKGERGQIAVCTCGVRKTGQKANKAAVDRAARLRDAYFEALKNNTLTMVDENGT